MTETVSPIFLVWFTLTIAWNIYTIVKNINEMENLEKQNRECKFKKYNVYP